METSLLKTICCWWTCGFGWWILPHFRVVWATLWSVNIFNQFTLWLQMGMIITEEKRVKLTMIMTERQSRSEPKKCEYFVQKGRELAGRPHWVSLGTGKLTYLPTEYDNQLSKDKEKIMAICFKTTGRLRLKMQKIHRVNLVRLNLLKSCDIIERHWICPRRNRPGPYKKKYGDAFENDFRTARRHDEDSLEIHCPAVESNHSRWIDSTWFSSFIERPWINSTHKIFNRFKFNRRRPL